VAACVASYVLVWVGAALTSLMFALVIDTAGQDTGDLGPLISGLVIGAVVLSLAWVVAMSLWLSRYGHMVRPQVGAIATAVGVIAALLAWLPLGVALGFTLPAATAWWSTDPDR
jgi:FtsH-binding integral membrane protein